MKKALPLFVVSLLFHFFQLTITAQSSDDPFQRVDTPQKQDNTDNTILAPDANGRLSLPANEAALQNLSVKLHDNVFYATRSWRPNGRLSWKVNVPEEGTYQVHICWAAQVVPKTARFYVDQKEQFSWLTERTGDNAQKFSRFAYTKKIGTLSLPKGLSEISMTVSNPNNPKEWGYIDFHALKLVPVKGLEEKLTTIRKSPRLGQSLENLQLLWGIEVPVLNGHISKQGSPGDKDYQLFVSASQKVKTVRWNMTDIDITGDFINNKCIALSLNPKSNKDPKFMWQMVSSLLPGVDISPLSRTGTYTVYSKDTNYQVQVWKDCFDIKAPGLLKTELKDELIALTQRAKKLPTLPKLGMTLPELQSFWGTKCEKGVTPDNLPINQQSLDESAYLLALSPQSSSLYWNNPLDFTQTITAVFWQNKCIALKINLNKHVKIRNPKDYAAILLQLVPGIRFSSPPILKEENFVLHSSSPKDFYSFHYVQQGKENYFVLTSVPLIKEIHASESIGQQEQARHFAEKLRQSEVMKDSSFLQLPLGKLDAVLTRAPSPRISGKSTRAWTLPNSHIMLVAAFDGSIDESSQTCRDLYLYSSNTRILDTEAGMLIAACLVAPSAIPAISPENMDKFFTITCDDEKKWNISRGYNKEMGLFIRIFDPNAPAPKSKASSYIEFL